MTSTQTPILGAPSANGPDAHGPDADFRIYLQSNECESVVRRRNNRMISCKNVGFTNRNWHALKYDIKWHIEIPMHAEPEPPLGWSEEPFDWNWVWFAISDVPERRPYPRHDVTGWKDVWYQEAKPQVEPCLPPGEKSDASMAERVEAFRKDFDAVYEKLLTPRS